MAPLVIKVPDRWVTSKHYSGRSWLFSMFGILIRYSDLQNNYLGM